MVVNYNHLYFQFPENWLKFAFGHAVGGDSNQCLDAGAASVREGHQQAPAGVLFQDRIGF